MSVSQVATLTTDVVLLIGTSVLLIVCLFFLIECTAALIPVTSSSHRGRWQDAKVTVLVPAHNEELVIGSTLEKLIPGLKQQDRLVVIADNCSDRTAEIARNAGAIVLERQDSNCRGKGYALDYGLRFLESDPPDVVVIVDADCIVNQGAIEQLTRCAIATGQPVQSVYLMAKPNNSRSSKDIVSQFSVIVKNLVRPRGLTLLGWSCLLTGTGMAFPWSVIRSVNLASGHIVEDMKLGLDLTLAGYKPTLCLTATVKAYLPTQPQAAKSQRTRWEHGHLQVMGAYIPILCKEAISQRRLDLLVSLLDLCIPPLSLLVILWLGLMTTSIASSVLGASWIPVAIAAIAGFCFLSAILIAWAGFGRKELPLLELLTIPFYIFWKIPVYLKFLMKPQNVWVRTEREAS
ncbi:MAG: glycosyltransferase family 2 protein [Scytonema sp. PMC 1069.18]|nr:glycosyltransferase family 2 protein [Scytonema sp. PMC 1069.18]MEC4880625.1 glycosyltransferase family 2 protein [Scytonema sp. PMC 1070.18]